VEKFIDTPVKRFSSGMYVRLAFAVAAHLEPEILIVDEVLAVGDAEFQKKCLGKMGEVSTREGRTVLFVSHNMAAIINLCTHVMLFEAGRNCAAGDAKVVVPTYLDNQSLSPKVIDLRNKARLEQSGKAYLAKASPSERGSSWSLPFGQPLSLDISIDALPSVKRVEVAMGIHSTRGFEVASWSNTCSNVNLPVQPGINTFRIAFENLCLLPGRYFLGISVRDGRGIDYIPEAVQFEIMPSVEAAKINAQNFRGAVVPSARVSILGTGAHL
jgi:lipopolysaccharide transport system ATP-binding protein